MTMSLTETLTPVLLEQRVDAGARLQQAVDLQVDRQREVRDVTGGLGQPASDGSADVVKREQVVAACGTPSCSSVLAGEAATRLGSGAVGVWR
jgi:hypothetical protein